MATKRRHFIGTGVVVVAVFLVGGGLAWRSWEQQGAGARETLAQAYADVQPAHLGTVVYDASRGSGRFSDDLPTRSVGVVVSTVDADAVRSKVEASLRAEGFRPFPGSSLTWERRDHGHLAKIDLSYVSSGERIAGPASRAVPTGSTGVLVRFLGAG
ncbi:MAG TPA: hypothetical protein VFZ17_03380 [Acidimicrobiia bacterium]|nr:hypothetical protein [Acidimicrobiia bacterium]